MNGSISAGLLMYRINEGELQIFLVHPGGPYFKKKDYGFWSIPKGLVEEGEKMLETAKREFIEETGLTPAGNYIDLGWVVQKSGKIVYAWAFESRYFDPADMKSNHFDMEWPPKSGRVTSFPEIDKWGFFDFSEASKKINSAQKEFLIRLKEKLDYNFNKDVK
jgi:predicted NUDIX family NTP pyrophosphohydrolase